MERLIQTITSICTGLTAASMIASLVMLYQAGSSILLTIIILGSVAGVFSAAVGTWVAFQRD